MRSSLSSAVFGAFLLAGGFVVAACVPEKPAASASQSKSYPIRGEVLGFQAENKVVILKHEDIPGLMPAMTMGFELADPKLAEGLKKGDQVEGTLMVHDDVYSITALTRKK
jgi:Cu/Ag efflux protein CusF